MRSARRILPFTALFALCSVILPTTLAGQQPAPALPPAATPAVPQGATAADQPPGGSTTDLPDAPGAATPPTPRPTGPTAVIDTSMGRITCKLFDKQAPEAAANFIALAEGTRDWTDPVTHAKMHRKPFYNGTTFHRVIPEFMIQGGDPLATGEGDPGYMFNDEFDPSLNFDVPGRLAMANSGPNTNGSQFFITEAPVEQLNQRYSLFGQCDDAGVSVVKTIARVPRDPQDKPLDPVTLIKVTIVREGRPIPPPPAAPAARPASLP